MSEEKFTPGPWILDWEKNPLLFPFIWQENRFAVAKVCGKPSAKLESTTIPVACLSDFAEPEKVLANAALIAAAPEMYEFIRWIRSVQGQCAIMKWRKFLPEILDKADEILHKARGEE